jgi:hypothetical protein
VPVTSVGCDHHSNFAAVQTLRLRSFSGAISEFLAALQALAHEHFNCLFASNGLKTSSALCCCASHPKPPALAGPWCRPAVRS